MNSHDRILNILAIVGIAVAVLCFSAILATFQTLSILAIVALVASAGFGAALAVVHFTGKLAVPTASNAALEEPAGEAATTAEKEEPEEAPVPEAIPAPAPQQVIVGHGDGGAVIQLLALLQEKGRLIDFLMDDVSRFDDTKVGAAARVVHQGCAEVLKEYFEISKVHEGADNAKVTLRRNFRRGDYSLSGNVGDKPPYTGRLVHPGWKVDNIHLPELKPRKGGTWPPVAPAQVEVS